jgi:hypothetical protein
MTNNITAFEDSLIRDFNALRRSVAGACRGREDLRTVAPMMAKAGLGFSYSVHDGLGAIASACFHTSEELRYCGHPALARKCADLAKRVAFYIRNSPERSMVQAAAA